MQDIADEERKAVVGKPSRRMHRVVTAADIRNALMSGSVSAQVDCEFFVVMVAYWECICAEDPELKSWIVREIERLVNQFVGLGVMGAYELLWKVSNGANPVLVDAIVSRGVSAVRNDSAHIARVSGLMYR